MWRPKQQYWIHHQAQQSHNVVHGNPFFWRPLGNVESNMGVNSRKYEWMPNFPIIQTFSIKVGKLQFVEQQWRIILSYKKKKWEPFSLYLITLPTLQPNHSNLTLAIKHNHLSITITFFFFAEIHYYNIDSIDTNLS